MEISQVEIVTTSLILIAFGMGMGLKFSDFKRIIFAPKGILIGLLGQMVVLPCIAILLATTVKQPVLAIGLILMGVCPGGSSSNYMSYLAKGDVALSISMTALNAPLSVFSVPLVFNLANKWVDGAAFSGIQLPLFETMKSIFFFTILPVLLGMILQKLKTNLANRWAPIISTAAFIILLLLTPPLIQAYFEYLRDLIVPAFLWVSVLFCLMLPAGHFLAKFSRLDERQRRSITVEMGVQNVALAVFIAIIFLGDPRYTIIPIAYLILMYVFVPGFIIHSRWREARGIRKRVF